MYHIIFKVRLVDLMLSVLYFKNVTVKGGITIINGRILSRCWIDVFPVLRLENSIIKDYIIICILCFGTPLNRLVYIPKSGSWEYRIIQ